MNVFEAIGAFFVLIGKGIGYFFYGIWWVLKTTVVTIAKVIAYLVMLAIRYFLVYLPVLVVAGMAIWWIFNPEGPNVDVFIPLEAVANGNYDFELTALVWEWLENTDRNILYLIIVIIKFALVIISAILEIIFVYILFGLFGSLVVVAITFILLIVVFLILPAASAVYSIIAIRYAERHNAWFYILCTLLTIAGAVICYMYAIPAI